MYMCTYLFYGIYFYSSAVYTCTKTWFTPPPLLPLHNAMYMYMCMYVTCAHCTTEHRVNIHALLCERIPSKLAEPSSPNVFFANATVSTNVQLPAESKTTASVSMTRAHAQVYNYILISSTSPPRLQNNA